MKNSIQEQSKEITRTSDALAQMSSNLTNISNIATEQNSALQKISDGSEQLKVKVSSLEGLLANIRNAIDEIDTNASANEQVAEKISDALM